MVNVIPGKVFQSYYTKSNPIVTYMIDMLSVNSTMKVLEPCAGDGVFVDNLISRFPNLAIDTFELNLDAVKILQNKYGNIANISVTYGDTLTHEKLSLFSNSGGFYDRIIANPPYGGWQDHERRKMLKGMYGNLSVKETYSLFLYRAINLLRENGVLVFIIPDTWLNLHRHTELRKYIFSNTKIIEIALFPSSFFPNVDFGYANLCIVTLKKSDFEDSSPSHQFEVVTGFKNPTELIVSNKATIIRQSFEQNLVKNNIEAAFFISNNNKVQDLINQASSRIGDIASCVTGFYSGNDKKFLYHSPLITRNLNKYCLVPNNCVYKGNGANNIINGIEEIECFVPIMKGGNTKYLKTSQWYMEWSVEAVSFYKKDKKARFQNSQYYFKAGIGVPMISSKRITAALIENRLFDQSIVGVFPHNSDLTYFLLAFFNSTVCNLLIRTINPSANNSANYLKKLPFINPPANILKRVDILVNQILSKLQADGLYDYQSEIELEEIFSDLYQIQ
jgi:adenine-specific DNA-methyltransferase